MADLSNIRIAIIATNYFEKSELVGPCDELRAMGATVDVIAPEPGEIQAAEGDKPAGSSVKVDKTLDQLDPDDYQAAVIPGGVVNADKIRVEEKAQAFVKAMYQAGKPVASICHGPWLLISSKIVEGKTLTSFPTLKDDLENAGASWVDREVVIDQSGSGVIITSRKPDDIPAFVAAIANQFK